MTFKNTPETRMPEYSVHLPTVADTLEFGADLASHIVPGDIVGLEGELGTGKTTLVRGLLCGLGYEGEVRSPTFNLVQLYATVPPVCHVDLYRLENSRQILDLGLSDYMASHVLLIEWIERAEGVIEPTTRIRLRFAESGREVEVE
jgi:tRNA threonylcarbamoyladenosine biosynthesis protein TsaE